MSTVLGSALVAWHSTIPRSAIGFSRPHQLGILIGKAPRNSCDTTTARIYDTRAQAVGQAGRHTRRIGTWLR